MKIFNFLESLDNTTNGKWFRILLAPVWLMLEYYCFIKYWKHIILVELVTNDELFNFLNNNEFGIKHGRLFKKDILDEDEFFSGRSLKECKEIIKKEYVSALTKLITDNCNTNIEDLITLQIITDTKLSVKDDEAVSVRIYEVYIQFCRYWWLQKAKQYTLVWTVFIILFVCLCILGCRLFM